MAEPPEKQSEEQSGRPTPQQSPPPLYSLVVVGASAGGIEALSTVLGALAPDFPAPIVVAQHLDPTRPSHLDAVLARRSRLPVRLVTDVAPLMPATVYVVSSDRDLEITDHEVRVRASTGTPSKPSINRLLSSAARAYGERLIAVILTGTGSDGAEGAREVKAAGGMVVIEDPATAAFPGMPRSLAPTTVDLVAHLDQIGPLLGDVLAGTYVPTPLAQNHHPAATEEGTAHEDGLAQLLAHVREHSGMDFTGYRRPTIVRRLQRRMVATKSPDLKAYRRYLTRHPEEYQRLASSFLIQVTEFFRDPEFFRTLRERVLPELIAQARAQGNQLRLWSAGCATGEEAYSLAILVAEALGPELSQFTVRLFATDLDERAVAFARQAIYPAAALARMPQERRDRYFTQVDGTYEVKKPIRSLVTCGEHNLGQRPPFPHIDLVLCRNVLIYFTPEMQRRALTLFAFALRPGGYLALGKAETTGALADYFVPVDPHLKLYRRGGETLPPPATLLQAQDTVSPSRPVSMRTRSATSDAKIALAGPHLAEMEREGDWLADGQMSRLAVDLPCGIVIVDRRYHIHAINSAALRLLDIYRPALGNDLVHLAERVPSPALRRIIDIVFLANSLEGADAGQPPEVTEVIRLETGLGETRDVEIAAYPHLPRRGGSERMAADRVDTALLLVTDVTQAIAARVAAELTATRERREPELALQRRNDDVEQLTAQLEQLRATNRQLGAANQELGSANLDLQRTSDDILLAREQEQASAEEIRTLNEELQASNEELETVNEELEAAVEELRASNDELAARSREVQELAETETRLRQASEAERARLSAILLGLGDAVLVVDPAGEPSLTNAAYTKMFGDPRIPFAAQDADGHPLPPTATPQQRAARGETFVMEFALAGDDGVRRSFEASGQPINSVGEVLGGVISVRDITERTLHRLQDEFLAVASHELRTPLTPLNAYLQLLDKRVAQQPTVDATTHRYIKHAQHQVQRLMRLVQDLLDVRRLEGGTFSLEMGRVALDQVAALAVELAQTIAPAGQTIQLVRPEQPVEPLLVDGDAARLEQVFVNLLVNAITYAPGTPRIDVRLRRVGNEAELQVQDLGPGIPPAELPRVLGRFYQVKRSGLHPARRGLGLGLYIANEIVQGHGGRLEVASVAGEGTTVTIWLPLAPSGRDGEDHERSAKPPQEHTPRPPR